MTLNLMLTSKQAVYLSADFRLTFVKDGTAIPDNYNTQKLIPVIRHDWAALIAYMGVASAPPLINNMGQWIVDQVQSVPIDGSFLELSNRLQALDTSLRDIRGDRRVAFSVVGFRKQTPFMMLVSNFRDFDHQTAEAGSCLRTYLRSPNQPEVRSVGSVRPDVFERVRLERLLRASTSRRLVPHLTRQALAETNANAAQRSNSSVSKECVSGYLLRSGIAEIGVHGIPENAPCFPNWVRRDLERAGVTRFEATENLECKGLPVQWRRMTARIFNGTIVRVHEFANDRVELRNDCG